MSLKIINDEQHEFWNKGIGQKWVKEDNSMNERFTILTKEFLKRAKIEKGDKVLDIGCGGGITSFEASKILGNGGYVLGTDISKILLESLPGESIAILSTKFLNSLTLPGQL